MSIIDEFDVNLELCEDGEGVFLNKWQTIFIADEEQGFFVPIKHNDEHEVGLCVTTGKEVTSDELINALERLIDHLRDKAEDISLLKAQVITKISKIDNKTLLSDILEDLQ